MEQEVASPSSKLPLSHSSFFLKDNSCLQLNSTISSVLACRIWEVQQPFFISSLLCPLQSKLAAFPLRQLIGPTSHRPNLFSKGCPATPLALLPEHCLLSRPSSIHRCPLPFYHGQQEATGSHLQHFTWKSPWLNTRVHGSQVPLSRKQNTIQPSPLPPFHKDCLSSSLQ